MLIVQNQTSHLMSSSSPSDALSSLRAAAESRQLYNQALLNRIAASQQQQSSLLPHDLLSFSQSTHFQGGNPGGILALAAARNLSGASVNRAYLSSSAAAGGSPTPSNANSALTRHYLQLLQGRQDAVGPFGCTNDSGKPSGGGDGASKPR